MNNAHSQTDNSQAAELERLNLDIAILRCAGAPVELIRDRDLLLDYESEHFRASTVHESTEWLVAAMQTLEARYKNDLYFERMGSFATRQWTVSFKDYRNVHTESFKDAASEYRALARIISWVDENIEDFLDK